MADDIVTIEVTDAMVKELLLNVEKANKNLKERKFFPTVSSYSSTFYEYDKIEADFYANTSINGKTNRLLLASSYIGKRNVKYKFNRKDRAELYLALILNCREAIDKNFKGVPLQENIVPEPDESDHTGQFLFIGMLPEDIKHPKSRENYIKARWENLKNRYEYKMHRHLTEMVANTEQDFTRFALRAYSESPRADRELIDLLEKYKYPKENMLKLLCDLEIPYKGFRNWESTDGMFKTTAKFVSFDKGEVTIEKGNGRHTSIELKYLRKADKDFVNKQTQTNSKPPVNNQP
ncbi:MAG: hypothetical protein LBT09_06505 [Planctomycetaceae bacterium]|jgi:hypothetical protein|nr:hypothetical protein [Planctomycetaceae bacterium]